MTQTHWIPIQGFMAGKNPVLGALVGAPGHPVMVLDLEAGEVRPLAVDETLRSPEQLEAEVGERERYALATDSGAVGRGRFDDIGTAFVAWRQAGSRGLIVATRADSSVARPLNIEERRTIKALSDQTGDLHA